eukprot:2421260-Alexandrium_andersonii.AAC.1
MLVLARRWRLQVLELRITRDIPLEPRRDVVHLFCYACGEPSRVAAVLAADGQWQYTDVVPPRQVLEAFLTREDEQIMGLEMLAVVLGLCSFMGDVEGRRCVIFTDNTGGE